MAGVDLSEGQLVAGRYQIQRMLGAGGMGAVYQVLDNNTRRARALKVMLPSVVADEEMRGRFQREAVVAAEVKSDHIAEVYDAGVDDDLGLPYIVLELLEGRDLGEILKARGPLPVADVALYLGQAALALDKAHAAGIVHRDLKPENLFVTYADDGSPRVKLLDFGIAKVMAATMSGPKTQGILGTPLFMAPEQMHDDVDVGPHTDIYALGHIGYALLVGEPYWRKEQQEADTVYGMLLKLVNGPQQAASQRALARRQLKLLDGFDEWFRGATAADPVARFGSASELAAALKRLMGADTAEAATDAPAPSPEEAPAAPATGSTAAHSVAAPATAAMPVGPTAAAGLARAAATTIAQAPAAGAPVDLQSSGSLAARAVTAGEPAAAGSSRVFMIGAALAVVAAVGVTAFVMQGEGGDPQLAGTTPSAHVSAGSEGNAMLATAAPTAATADHKLVPAPEPTVAAEPQPSLVGRWKSGRWRDYDVVWTGAAYEFRIVDDKHFKTQLYMKGEPRFLLIPDAAGYLVEDRVRPLPPPGQRYDAAARTSCVHSWRSAGDKPLRARLDGDRLLVKMVFYTPTMAMFKSRAGLVVGCEGLEAGSVVMIESKLDRQ